MASSAPSSRPPVSRSSSRGDLRGGRSPTTPSAPAPGQQQGNGNSDGKPADYVYFDRTTSGFSDDAVPRAKTAQLKLEHFYKIAVEAAIERNTRCVVCVAIS